MTVLVCNLLLVYLLVLVARAVLSWFPVRPGTAISQLQSLLFRLTEPILAPMRRLIPPVGVFDLSFLVLFIAISILRGVLCR